MGDNADDSRDEEDSDKTIRVNSIHPGGIETPMVQEASNLRAEEIESDEPREYMSPIPRIGQPAEVAQLALFLASEKSSYCTGSEFIIDGGLLAGNSAADFTDT